MSKTKSLVDVFKDKIQLDPTGIATESMAEVGADSSLTMFAQAAMRRICSPTSTDDPEIAKSSFLVFTGIRDTADVYGHYFDEIPPEQREQFVQHPLTVYAMATIAMRPETSRNLLTDLLDQLRSKHMRDKLIGLANDGTQPYLEVRGLRPIAGGCPFAGNDGNVLPRQLFVDNTVHDGQIALARHELVSRYKSNTSRSSTLV